MKKANTKYYLLLLLLVIVVQVSAAFYFRLVPSLIPRETIRQIIVSFKGCKDYPKGSDLCRDFKNSYRPDQFELRGKYVYSKPYAKDTNSYKYDAVTGKIVEVCGFWIKGCHTPEELKTFKAFN